MNKIEIRHIIYGIAILTIIGIALYALNNKGRIHIPSTVEMGQSSSALMGLVVIYFILGFAILYLFFKPKNVAEVGAVAGASILWGIY